jgi:hypothetical protein
MNNFDKTVFHKAIQLSECSKANDDQQAFTDVIMKTRKKVKFYRRFK